MARTSGEQHAAEVERLAIEAADEHLREKGRIVMLSEQGRRAEQVAHSNAVTSWCFGLLATIVLAFVAEHIFVIVMNELYPSSTIEACPIPPTPRGKS